MAPQPGVPSRSVLKHWFYGTASRGRGARRGLGAPAWFNAEALQMFTPGTRRLGGADSRNKSRTMRARRPGPGLGAAVRSRADLGGDRHENREAGSQVPGRTHRSCRRADAGRDRGLSLALALGPLTSASRVRAFVSNRRRAGCAYSSAAPTQPERRASIFASLASASSRARRAWARSCRRTSSARRPGLRGSRSGLRPSILAADTAVVDVRIDFS